MKRVYIIHGWGGNPNEGWFPWLARELREKSFKVYAPLMPDADKPKVEIWVSFIENLVGPPDKNTFFVGHSIGCQAILRYFEKLPEETKIGGAILVAGWFTLTNLETDEDREVTKPWLERPINFEKVKKRAGNLTAIFSENDKFVPLENKIMFEEKLGCRTIIDGHKGHFSGEDGIIELPIVLEELLKMTK